MDDIYRDIIIEKFKSPDNKGRIEGGIQASEANTMCGDKVSIFLKIDKDNGVVEDAKFEGGGCAISQAATDMLLDKVKGMRVDEVQKLEGHDVENLLGVQLSPARKKCAYLSLLTVKKALKSEEHRN